MSMLRRHALSYTITLILFAVVAALAWGIIQKSRRDTQSQQLAIEVLQTLFTSGSAEMLIELAHADLLATESPQSLQRYIHSIEERIGSLQSMESINGSSEMSLNPFVSNGLMASYSLNLVFEEELAEANIELKLENGSWLISRLSILGELLND